MRLNQSFIFFLILLLSYGRSVVAQKPKDLRQAVDQFAEDEQLKHASWGFMAVSTADTSQKVFMNPDLSLINASTQKLITTITALSLLGIDYQFETLLQYSGTLTGDTLKGDLIIKGMGDPTFGAVQMSDSLSLETIFNEWLESIKKAGIKSIKGNIVSDGTFFDDHMIPSKWNWEDIGNYYGAGAHALSVHENMYTVFFRPGNKEGEPARVLSTRPRIDGMTFINHVTTGAIGSGDQVYIFGVPGQKQRWLTGTVPLGQDYFAVKGSMPDPGFFAASAFRSFLKKNQISIDGEVFTHQTHPQLPEDAGRIVLSKWLSPPLNEIAARTNKKSVNSYAENLFKVLGKEVNDEGSFEASAEVIEKFWQENGIDKQGMRIHDGSGLSPFNLITVSQLTQILILASRNSEIYESLIQGLPVAGRSGSLSGLFKGTPSEGLLRAKSGYLDHVWAYAGYTEDSEENMIAFTIIVNNYTGSAIQMRKKITGLLNAITQYGL
ncbi:MAG: D-alanyl-D-alanine carboxypeptidase/D-alanyl-D-alanine-endopeptidase [Bacteroidota bacterium]